MHRVCTNPVMRRDASRLYGARLSVERQPFVIEDLYELGWVENPAISPDGRWVAWVRVSVDRAANRYQRAIWLSLADGSTTRRLTSGVRSDSSPRWSPDSQQIVFVSNRDGDHAQLYLITITGGEARCLSHTRHGVSSPSWSPDGKRIAFLSALSIAECEQEDAGNLPELPSDAFDRKQEQERRAHAEKQDRDPLIVRKLPYRSGTTYFDQRNDQIHLIDVPADDECDVGQARRLTDGALSFGPPAWSHDGQLLISTHGRDPDADTLFGFDDVVRVPILTHGRGSIERLTSPGFSYSDPKPSPDGRWITYMSNESGCYRVYVVSLTPNGQPAGGKWHISTGVGYDPKWPAAGGRILFQSEAQSIAEASYAVKGDSFVSEPQRAWSTRRLSYFYVSAGKLDVTPDGKVIAIVDADSATPETRLRIILNFVDEVRHRLAVGAK